MTKGEKIKSLRMSHGFTQDELAKRLNTTKQTVYKYENDIITNIPLDKIEIMALLFDVTPAAITGWEDSDPNESMSPNEKTLLSKYRQLNEEGQGKVSDYTEDLVRSGRYIKVDPAGVVEKAE